MLKTAGLFVLTALAEISCHIYGFERRDQFGCSFPPQLAWLYSRGF